MIFYALLVSGWVIGEEGLMPFSITISERSIPGAIVHYRSKERCEAMLSNVVDQMEATGLYSSYKAECSAQRLPLKPKVISVPIDAGDIVG